MKKYFIDLVVGQTLTSFRGETHTVTGWREPHKPGSTGRIYTDKGEFFPSVFDMAFEEKEIEE